MPRCRVLGQGRAERDERRKHVVLVVDEAHLLTNDQLEQLQLLTNTDMDARSPLTLVLLGQPTLRRRLKLGHFAALDQRIGLCYHLPGLPLDETAGYLNTTSASPAEATRCSPTTPSR